MEKRVAALTRSLNSILPNIGGPDSEKRKLLTSVAYSIILYAAPVWAKCIQRKKYRDILERMQRRLAIRVCSAYRTTSTAALQVLADDIPVDLRIKERTRRRETEDEGGLRQEILDEWQRRWREDTSTTSWTRKLIPDVRPWINRKHGTLNYFITQTLTGHGCFKSYLHRFKRAEDDVCAYCQDTDTVEHTVFMCNRWERQTR